MTPETLPDLIEGTTDPVKLASDLHAMAVTIRKTEWVNRPLYADKLEQASKLIAALRQRVAALEGALQRARPYVANVVEAGNFKCNIDDLDAIAAALTPASEPGK